MSTFPRRCDRLISAVSEKNDLIMEARWHVGFQLLVIDDYVARADRGEQVQASDNELLHPAKLGSLPFEPRHVEHHFFSQESWYRHENVAL